MLRIKRLLQDRAGFTLIELMIVVVIVGVLAGIAAPIYTANLPKKAMTSEGVALLGSVRTAQRAYHAEHDSYCLTTSDLLDAEDIEDNKYFKAFSLSVSGDTFTATATGSGDAEGITVTIDQDGDIDISGI
jgi:prepilin-type N-terminal cleavage/methylation domain-containing protein